MNDSIRPTQGKLVTALTALSENKYLSAVRAGMVSVAPLTIIGGLFTILANLPFERLAKALEPHHALLQLPVTATFGMLGVFAAFAVAYDLGKQLKQEAFVSASMATLVFLLAQLNPPSKPKPVESAGTNHPPASLATPETNRPADILTNAAPAAGESHEGEAEESEPTLNMSGLGSAGLFTAILMALVTVWVQKFFTDRNFVIKLPGSVPSVVYESFLSLTPMLFLVLAFWMIRFVLGVDINALVQWVFKPLVFALNTLPGILVYAFLVTLLWSIGINGDNAMDAVVAPIFLQYLAANTLAAQAGQPLPYVTALGFFTTFVNVGGTGATIALALVMLNSKEPGFRKVSRLSLPTQIFQINEPIFFGFPIVLNPVFMVPYVLNALILTTCSFLLFQFNILQKPFVSVPWTMPPILGHYLVTGGDWKAAVWGAASIVIAMVVYWPFAKYAERQRLAAEATGTAHE